MNILKDGNKYHFFNALTINDKLEPKNYIFNFNQLGQCYLEDIEGFKYPEKIYDVDANLRSLIQKSFVSYQKNLGVLLSGSKGMGKSLTAKLICKESNLPIIVINQKIPSHINFIAFLNEVKQDYILFVDEFEKLFETKGDEDFHGQDVFLSFMDGVITNDHKVLFLLTTNDSVNEFLINRPSRIKFLQEYTELPEEIFNMIVEDRLDNKDWKDDLENNVSLLNLNIDLLINIISDVNLFDKPFSEFKDMYNYKFENYKYEITKVIDGVEVWGGTCTRQRRFKPSDTYIADYTVDRMIKFTKDEIIFESTEWSRDEKNKDVEIKILIKLKPFSFQKAGLVF